MSIKIAVDNNFFDNFDLLQEHEKARIIGAFKSKRLSFYPNPELISELLGLYRTKRQDLLKRYISYFLGIMGYRFFNEWGRIIRIELGIINNEHVFIGSGLLERLKHLLENIMNGSESPADVETILLEIVKEKDKKYKQFKNNQDHHIKLLKEKNVVSPNWSFEDFYRKDFVIKIIRDLIKDILGRAGVQSTDVQIDRFLNNPAIYPYLHTSWRVFMAIFYRHIVLKRTVDEGDAYDQYHLIYATKTDYLITEDKRLRDFGADVYKTTEKVISLRRMLEFI